MDRKTVLAFVLIAVVLILTPWYMDLVAPQRVAINDFETPENPPATDEVQPTVSEPSLPLNQGTDETENLSINVENQLYRATLSNAGGGSFSSFELLEYNRFDSTLVNLIDVFNKKHMLLGFVSVDGQSVLLEGNWSPINYRPVIKATSRQQSVVFQTIFNG